MSVRSQLFVVSMLIESMPPFVTASGITRCIQLFGIVKVVNQPTFVVVVSGHSQTFAGREKRNRPKSNSIGLNRQCVQIGHQSPFLHQIIQSHIDPLAARIGRSTVSHL